MFESLMSDIKENVATQVFRSSASMDALRRFFMSLPQTLVHDEVSILGRGDMRQQRQGEGPATASREAAAPPEPVTFRREIPKVGRNDPCPCGSGKKYKKCCGAG